MKKDENLNNESMAEITKLIDKKHKMNCNVCGQEIDMRDLSQVFAHEPCKGFVNYETMEKIPFSGSKRMDEDITWSNAGWWQKPLL